MESDQLGFTDNTQITTAMASGDIRIHGPINKMVIDIAARSEEGTEIFIPISYDLEVAETD